MRDNCQCNGNVMANYDCKKPKDNCGCKNAMNSYVNNNPMKNCDYRNAMNNYDCKTLKRKIYEYGLTLVDCVLFLDTHPCNQEALDYCKCIRDEYEEYCKIYAKKYGPLTVMDVKCENRWTWVDEPMPWEREA